MVEKESFREENEKYDPVKHLKSMRFDYRDEVPEEIIHGDADVKNFKVRKNWWFGVILDLETLITMKKEVGQETLEKINAFQKKYTSQEFKDRLTTAEDISEANAFIDDILAQFDDSSNDSNQGI